MKKSTYKKIQLTFFLRQLLKHISPAIALVSAIAVVYVYLMRFVNHDHNWIPYLVVLFAIIKTVYFTFYTFRKVNKSIRQCHSFGQLLWIFGMLVFLIIFSFAVDYMCLSETNTDSFQGYNMADDYGLSESLFEYFYFSIVTFASVGYGDIVPMNLFARLLVMIEIGQSFVLVIFGFSNINNIRTAIEGK